MNEMRTQGNIKLNKKYNVLRLMFMKNKTNGYFSVQHSYFFDSLYEVTST